MFCPTSFFSNWSILIWFAKKLVGQNMNIWIYTPSPQINVLVTSLPASRSAFTCFNSWSARIEEQGSNAYPFYKNYKLWLLSSVKFWSVKLKMSNLATFCQGKKFTRNYNKLQRLLGCQIAFADRFNCWYWYFKHSFFQPYQSLNLVSSHIREIQSQIWYVNKAVFRRVVRCR